jgi:multiple sugar transport system substrate-binding protein
MTTSAAALYHRKETSPMKCKTLLTAALVGAGLIAAGPVAAQEKLTVWWVKGFYKAEDDALFEAIKKFEAKNKGVKIELSQYPIQDMIPKTVAALDSGSPPDVAYADSYDFQVTAKWAYDGKLEDISSVIDPLRAKFEPRALSTTFLLNNTNADARLLRLPGQAADHAHPVLEGHAGRRGLQGKRHPEGLEGLLGLLVLQGADRLPPEDRQPRLRHRQPDGRGLHRLVLLVPDLHGRLQRQAGQRLGQAAGRRPGGAQGLINAMTDYTAVYAKGCTPPSSTSWKDPDNNVAFHNKTTVMTHNATISIAAKWLDDMNNATLTAGPACLAKKNYTELIATAGFPNKPDGSKMTYRAR